MGADSDSGSSPIEALNDDLLLEIIVRVDHVKCTFRCKCVCKRWFHLINPKSDPCFIRRYLDPAPAYCLLHSFAASRLFHITTMENDRGWFETSLFLSFLPCPDPSRINILSSINGLILCCPESYDHSAYFICNPITRQWLSLPPPPLCSERARLFPGKGRGRVLAGFTFEDEHEGLMVNAGCRFRVVCFPAHNESSELGAEVFSSETGQWATCFVQRPDVAVSDFTRVAVCNGIAYWLEHSVFTAFNLWDNSFRFFPAPCCSEGRSIRFFGQSQGFLRAVSVSRYIEDEGPSYEVYVLKDCDWFMERVIRLRELKSTSNWLSKYPWRFQQKVLFIAFHPQNGDVVYMRCNKRIVECNMQSGEWREIDKVEVGSFSDHRITAPLMLPWWPTPLPQNQNQRYTSQTSVIS